MTQKKGTTLLLILSITLFFLASFVVTTVRAPAGPSYTLGASPTTLNEEEGNVIITFAITGGTANTAYTFRFTVTKPGGAGQASVSLPTGGQLALTPTTPSGTYSGSYRVQRSDPLGLWNITATAYSPAPSTTNNFGTYNVLVTVSPSQLTVSSLSTYNQYGTP